MKSTLNLQLDVAEQKVAATHSPVRYLISSMLAGAYIGIAVVLMASAAGPFAAVGNPAAKLVGGAVFAIGLILVVFAGAELVTSAMMILAQGAFGRRISWLAASATLLFCLVGNLLGSLLFGWMVVQSGLVNPDVPAGGFVAAALTVKGHESLWELFWRAVLCNILVCLAIWSANRSKTEAGKAIVIFWCLLAFVTSGFEHVVANMTTFAIGVFSDPMMTSWSEFGRNMGIVGLGNLVGGAIFVGAAYFVVAGPLTALKKSVETAS